MLPSGCLAPHCASRAVSGAWHGRSSTRGHYESRTAAGGERGWAGGSAAAVPALPLRASVFGGGGRCAGQSREVELLLGAPDSDETDAEGPRWSEMARDEPRWRESRRARQRRRKVAPPLRRGGGGGRAAGRRTKRLLARAAALPAATPQLPRLRDWARDCPRSPEIARYCLRLPDTARDCPRLPRSLHLPRDRDRASVAPSGGSARGAAHLGRSPQAHARRVREAAGARGARALRRALAGRHRRGGGAAGRRAGRQLSARASFGLRTHAHGTAGRAVDVAALFWSPRKHPVRAHPYYLYPARLCLCCLVSVPCCECISSVAFRFPSAYGFTATERVRDI